MPDQILPGQILIGRYKIIREIGSGGMGAVYLAEDLREHRLSEEVAIKIPHREFCGDPGFITRFEGEARKQFIAYHPNIIRVRDLEKEEENNRPSV